MVIKALAHPLRMEILHVLATQQASPIELSRRVDASLGVVSYHVRVLAELGAIRLVRQAPRRGAIEHYYEAVPGLGLDVLAPVLDEEGQRELEAELRALRERVERLERDGRARGVAGAPVTVLLMRFAGVTPAAR